MSADSSVEVIHEETDIDPYSNSVKKFVISNETYCFSWLLIENDNRSKSFTLLFDPLLEDEKIEEIKILFKGVKIDDVTSQHRPKIINDFNSDSLDLMKFLISKGFDVTPAFYTALSLNTDEYDWRESIKDFTNTHTPLKVSNVTPTSSLEIFFNLRYLFNQNIAESALKAFVTRFDSLLDLYLNLNAQKFYKAKDYFEDIKPEYFEMFMILTEILQINTTRKSEIISKMFSNDSHLNLLKISRIIANDFDSNNSLASTVKEFLNSKFYEITSYSYRSNKDSQITKGTLISAIIVDYYDEKWIHSAMDTYNKHWYKSRMNFDDFLVILDYYQDLEDDQISFEWILELSGKEEDENNDSPF